MRRKKWKKRGMDMAKLIAFYSRAGENYFGGQYRTVAVGNTEKVANQIAEITGGTLFKIQQKVPYAADYESCIRQAKADQQAKAQPELAALPDSLDGYDEIYLGYPNYWGDLPMAVYTFLESLDWAGKTIHPFCTHEGSGLSGTERKIAAACKGAHVTPGLAIRGSDVDESKGRVQSWLSGQGGSGMESTQKGRFL